MERENLDEPKLKSVRSTIRLLYHYRIFLYTTSPNIHP